MTAENASRDAVVIERSERELACAREIGLPRTRIGRFDLETRRGIEAAKQRLAAAHRCGPDKQFARESRRH